MHLYRHVAPASLTLLKDRYQFLPYLENIPLHFHFIKDIFEHNITPCNFFVRKADRVRLKRASAVLEQMPTPSEKYKSSNSF